MRKSDDEVAHDKHAIAKSFGDAAATYNVAAGLQQKVGINVLRRVTARADGAGLGSRVLDIGCGTGYIVNRLAASHATVYALDIAEGMLGYAKRASAFSHVNYVCADAEALPLANHSVDVVVSNFAIQWCPDKVALFNEVARVLSPGGVFVFSMPGSDTLCELKSSWKKADPDHSHVNHFCSLNDVQHDVQHSALEVHSLEAQREVMYYHKLQELTHELKSLGAHNVTDGRARQLTGKGTLKQLIQAYEEYRQDDGMLPATWNVIYGVLRKPS